MSILEILKAIVYGVVEGITEWLPVSSTGHLILLNDIMPMNVSPEFWSLFLVVIQLGAILAVVVYFWKRIWPFNTKVKSKPFIRYDVMNLWVKIIVACIPAALVGLLFEDWLDEHLYNSVVVAIMLILVGIAFILVESRERLFGGRRAGADAHSNNADRPAKAEAAVAGELRVKTIRELTYKDVIIIGLFQVIAAIFPGTSRSGATIIGGLLIGISRPVIAEFTFYLAIPVMAGASLLKLIKFGLGFTFVEFILLVVGCVVAFIVSLAAIRFLMDYVKKHDFKVFGYYRIILGVAVLLYFTLLAK